MKKTLFTLACAALVAPAFAGEAITEPITITLPGSTETPTWKGALYKNTHHIDQQTEQDVIDEYAEPRFLRLCGSLDIGFYAGGNNADLGENRGINGEGSLTTSADNVASVKLNGRSGCAGDNFVMVLVGNELIGKVVNSLTLSGSGSTSSALNIGGTFYVALYDDTTLVDYATASLSSTKSEDLVTAQLTLDNDITYTESNKIMIAFVGQGGSATSSYTISNIQLTATPEPATATLSLLALAGLASRRRRH